MLSNRIIALIILAGVLLAIALTWNALRRPARDAGPVGPGLRGVEVPLQPSGATSRSEFGTDPSHSYLPRSAIDSGELPNVVLSDEDGGDSPLPYYAIARGTYLLFGNLAQADVYNRGWTANAGFVVTSKGVVVIDALGTPRLGQRLIATIRSVTDRPITHLILTHGHPDHALGAIAFRRLGGVKIVAHQAVGEDLVSATFRDASACRQTLLAADMEDVETVTPDVYVGGDMLQKTAIRVGNHTFEIYNVGTHHSHGDLVVHQVREGVVWVSDLAYNQRVASLVDGDTRIALQNQDWLLKTFARAKLLVPGHGGAQRPPFPMVRRTQAYVARLRDLMTDAANRGMDLAPAVDRAELQDWYEAPLYGLLHRANANHVYREIERERF